MKAVFRKIQGEHQGSNCAEKLLPKVYEYGGRIPQTKKKSDATILKYCNT